MSRVIRIFMNTMQNILIVIGILVVITFLVPRIFGIIPFVVLSGSMEDQIKTGAIAYADTRAKVEDVKVGDVIVFKVDKEYVTHRVVSINEDNTFTTKGDANETEDLAPVKFEDFGGQTIFSIPYLGYLLSKIQTRTGIFIISLIVGLNFVYLIFVPDEENNKRKQDDEIRNEKEKTEV